MVNQWLVLRHQQVNLQYGQPGAMAPKLFATVKGFSGGGQHFDDEGGIEQHVTELIVELHSTTDHHQVRIREEPLHRGAWQREMPAAYLHILGERLAWCS